MALLTDSTVDNFIDIPAKLPLTELKSNNWIILASIEIADVTNPIEFIYRWLQINVTEILSDVDDVCAAGGRNNILDETPNAGLAYVVLVRDFDPNITPYSQPYLDFLPVPQEAELAADSVAPIHATRSNTSLVVTDPGVYSVVVANNTSNRKLAISVNASIRVIFP